jgi:hypothetical protein
MVISTQFVHSLHNRTVLQKEDITRILSASYLINRNPYFVLNNHILHSILFLGESTYKLPLYMVLLVLVLFIIFL